MSRLARFALFAGLTLTLGLTPGAQAGAASRESGASAKSRVPTVEQAARKPDSSRLLYIGSGAIEVKPRPCKEYAAPSFDRSQPPSTGGELCGPGATLDHDWGYVPSDPSGETVEDQRAYDLFHPYENGFLQRRAYLMAAAAHYIYPPIDAEGEDFEGWFVPEMAKYGLVATYVEDKDTDTEVGVMSNDRIVILTFRGTSSAADARTDARQHFIEMPPHWGDEILLHTGFHDAWMAIRGKVLPALDAHGVKDKQLWITGHSLGGAIATVAAYDLDQIQGIEVEGVRTFGQPRVGDENFYDAFVASGLHDRFHRWQLEGDPIPAYFDDGLMPGCDSFEISVFPFVVDIDCEVSPPYQHVGLVMDVLVDDPNGDTVYVLDAFVDDHVLPNHLGGAEIEHVRYDDALWQWLEQSESEWVTELMPPLVLDAPPIGFLP